MLGRKKTKRRKRNKNRHATMRFKMSLLFLMAVMIFGVFLLLFALIGAGSDRTKGSTAAVSASTASEILLTKTTLDDADLGFTLKIPVPLGEWLYRIGEVKSPLDDAMSDKFVSIYIPQRSEAATNNFDNLTVSILVIREFSKKEWSAMDRGCKRGVEDYCAAIGTKIDETKDTVYTYTKPEACPQDVQSKCNLADSIIKSFTIR